MQLACLSCSSPAPYTSNFGPLDRIVSIILQRILLYSAHHFIGSSRKAAEATESYSVPLNNTHTQRYQDHTGHTQPHRSKPLENDISSQSKTNIPPLTRNQESPSKPHHPSMTQIPSSHDAIVATASLFSSHSRQAGSATPAP